MKVSLIIPVYNVSAFLGKCLDSVQAQTYKDLEVIIVNDGSTDNSLEIIESYVAANANFKAYTIENSGQGGARNYGLERASGDYIAFLDSDDYISSDCIERMAETALEENSDIVVCNCYDVREDGSVIFKSENNIANKTTSVFETPTILFNRVAPWGKLFKRQIFGDLRFATRVWYEDMRLIPKLYLNAERISYIDDALFYYVQRAGSTMNNKNAVRNLEIIETFDSLFDYYKEKGVYDTFKQELEYLVIDHVAIATVTRVALCNSEDRKEVLKKLEQYLAGFEGLYSNKYIPNLTRNKRLVMYLNRYRLYSLTALCMNTKNKISN